MKKRMNFKKKAATLLGGMYVMWTVLSGGSMLGNVDVVKAADNKVPGIAIDGDIAEWGLMKSFDSSDSGIEEWKMTMSADKSMLYFCFGGTAVSQWDQAYLWKTFNIKYDNGTDMWCQINNLESSWIMPGAEVEMVNGAHWNNRGDYAVECALPIKEGSFKITFAGHTISSDEIPSFVGEEEKEPVYDGIVIDGKYDDWKAVAKTDAECTSHDYECLSSVACIMEGDNVYLYIKDGATGTAAGAGTHSNGRYSITTDLGRQITFQISAANGGSVSGVAGAKTAYYGNEWEISIPVSELPQMLTSISFGLYQCEPFVTDIMDLTKGNSNVVGHNGMVYDGLYGDWDTYPHTLIQYATAGTQTDKVDGEGALCLDGSTVFGHVVTGMQAHLQEAGGEFSSAVSICFNGKRDYNGSKTWNLYPRFVAVDKTGAINWNPKLKDLEPGSYEFYIADARGEYNTWTLKNVSDLAEHEKFFGKITMTIGEKVDETEFYIDLEQVAKFLSHYSNKTVKASDFKVVEAQFGRIGQEWLSTAGASAGPYLGVAICMAVSAGVLIKRRRSNKVVK